MLSHSVYWCHRLEGSHNRQWLISTLRPVYKPGEKWHFYCAPPVSLCPAVPRPVLPCPVISTGKISQHGETERNTHTRQRDWRSWGGGVDLDTDSFNAVSHKHALIRAPGRHNCRSTQIKAEKERHKETGDSQICAPVKSHLLWSHPGLVVTINLNTNSNRENHHQCLLALCITVIVPRTLKAACVILNFSVGYVLLQIVTTTCVSVKHHGYKMVSGLKWKTASVLLQPDVFLFEIFWQ